MPSSLQHFLKSCVRLPDGFASLHPTKPWRLGAVLFAASDGHFAAVQKAPRPGYEFSDRWALPGGMVRVRDGTAVGEGAIEAVVARVRAETGLELADIAPRPDLGPVMTSYTVKGERRYTLVATFWCEMVARATLNPSDGSIQMAEWLKFAAPNFGEFAPANRLVLAHILWPRFDEASRDQARSQIEEALDQCNTWAAEAGEGSAAAPWAQVQERAEWRSTWPS